MTSLRRVSFRSLFGPIAAAAADPPEEGGGGVGTNGTLPVSFTLTNSITNATSPFSVGHVFARTNVPTGSGIAVTGATAQVTVKNLWDDGSAKFAIISGVANLTAATPATVTLDIGTASSGTALTTTDLKNTSITATTDAGAFGSASWSGTDWDSPFETWVSGHKMSCWTFRKQIGSDAHLVAWLEVCLYDSGAVEVLPWVENGYLLITGPTSKSATYSFTLGGSSRFSQSIDIPHHCRTVLINGSVTSYWLSTAQDIIVKHDGDYMQASNLVPSYFSKASGACISDLPSSYAPLQQGIWPTTMGSGGYSRSIGLLPEWDVTYLTSATASTFKGVIFQGYSAGRYPTHYRDESYSNGMARISNHTTLQVGREPDVGYVTTPATSGTAPSGFATSHQPSIGYVPYLITGRRYFLDEVQFVASFNSMSDPASVREDGSGIVKTDAAGTIRHAAWMWRTLAQAITATPDSDTTLLTEFRNLMTNQIDYYDDKYVVTAPNAFGLVKPYEAAGAYGDPAVSGTIWLGAMWMQDFLTAAWGYSKSLSMGLTSGTNTKLDALFTWKAKSIVGRLGAAGDATGSPYRDFAPYNWALAPAAANFDTGTGFYSNWRAAYNATYGGTEADTTANNGPYTSPGTDVDGDIRNYINAEFQIAESLPAIAYAVKHGVTGAEDAYQRLTNTGNWAELTAGCDSEPVWSVSPRPIPGWARNLVVMEWREIANTHIGDLAATNEALTTSGGHAVGAGISFGARMDAWCGLSVDNRRGHIYSAANGGHGDYYGNEICRIDMMADVPAWSEVLAGSSGNVILTVDDIADAADRAYAHYTDGKPASRHSGSLQQFLERHNRALALGGSLSSRGSLFENVESYQVDVGWDAYDCTVASPPYGYSHGSGNNGWAVSTQYWSCAKDPRTECIYTHDSGGSYIRKFTPATTAGSGTWNGTWATAPFNPYTGARGGMAVDTTRGKLFWVLGDWTNDYALWDIDTATLDSSGALPASAARTSMRAVVDKDSTPDRPAGSGCVYVPQLDAYLVRQRPAGGTVYKIDASTLVVSELSTTSGGSVPIAAGFTGEQGIYTRWLFVPALRGVVYFPSGVQNGWFLRTH